MYYEIEDYYEKENIFRSTSYFKSRSKEEFEVVFDIDISKKLSYC